MIIRDLTLKQIPHLIQLVLRLILQTFNEVGKLIWLTFAVSQFWGKVLSDGLFPLQLKFQLLQSRRDLRDCLLWRIRLAAQIRLKFYDVLSVEVDVVFDEGLTRA
jgi:hypothetical protein